MKKESKAPGKGKAVAKITAVFLAVVILLAAGGVGGWYLKKQFEPKAEVDHNNQIAITPGEEESGIMTLSAETVETEDGAKVHRLTATLSPAGSTGQIDWSIAWGEEAVYWDGQEIGQDKADKGEVTDYISLTPTSSGSRTADVVGLKDFGTKAVITAAVRSNPAIKATCTVDYVMRMTHTDIRLRHFDNIGGSSYNAKINLIFYMSENEEEAYQAALHPVRPSLLKTTSFPNQLIAGSGFTVRYGACATDDYFTEGERVNSEANTTSPDMQGSCTYILQGDDLILSECATIRYAQALVYAMTNCNGTESDMLVAYTGSDPEYGYRATWEEFRPVGAQFTGSLLEDGAFSLKVGDRPLRIKDVLINRFTNQPDPHAEDGCIFDTDGNNDKGIIYDFEKNAEWYDWNVMKSHLQNPIATATGEEMSKYSLIFKLEIPKTGQVGFYALEFDYPASSVSLDESNIYM